MFRLAILACLVVACSTSPGRAFFAGFGGEPAGLEVEIAMAGGRTVKGTLALRVIEFDSDLGKYELEPDKVRSIRFSPPEGEVEHDPRSGSPILPATVVTRSGEELSGRVWLQHWQIQTDLGRLTPDPKAFRTLTFSEAVGLGEGPAATVGGTLRLGGRPARGTLRLQPEAGEPIRGESGPDGTFRIVDVPPGDYRVGIETDAAPPRFSDPSNWTLTISVKPGMNTFDFNLPAPADRP